VERRHARDQRSVVGKMAVAMNFAEIFEEKADEIVGVRALRVARELHSLPGIQMRVKFVFQFVNFAANALNVAGGLIGGIGETAKLDYVPFERINRLLTLLLGSLWIRNFCCGGDRLGRLHSISGAGGRSGLKLPLLGEFSPPTKPFPREFTARLH
jgi:hypothetical protein